MAYEQRATPCPQCLPACESQRRLQAPNKQRAIVRNPRSQNPKVFLTSLIDLGHRFGAVGGRAQQTARKIFQRPFFCMGKRGDPHNPPKPPLGRPVASLEDLVIKVTPNQTDLT